MLFLLPYNLRSVHNHVISPCYIVVNKTFFDFLVEITQLLGLNIIQTTKIQVKAITRLKNKEINIDSNGQSFCFILLKSGPVYKECKVYGLKNKTTSFENLNLTVCH